jgi:rod shape-determining protein MreC
MPRMSAPRSSVLIVLTVFVIVNAMLFGGRLTSWVADRTGHWLAPLASGVGSLRAVAGIALGRGDLAVENRDLRDQVQQLQARLAQQENLQEQLAFYTSALNIRDRLGADPIPAGIFSYPQGSGTFQVVVNRGADDGVARGMVAAMATGALVGTVEQVFAGHAVVQMIGDPGIEVTGRIAGTDVSGLVRTSDTGSVILDLVQKDEQVSEGQTVVTTGDDQYPAGLVIGTIRSVDNDAATLFKTVRISPAVAQDGASGRVLLIRP